MTEELDRALAAVAFDGEANSPRSGWKRQEAIETLRIERWTRQSADCKALVVGMAADTDSGGAGYFTFVVMRGEDVLTRGESSRRGWAMDGADEALPTVKLKTPATGQFSRKSTSSKLQT